jgi:hypothetical protein
LPTWNRQHRGVSLPLAAASSAGPARPAATITAQWAVLAPALACEQGRKVLAVVVTGGQRGDSPQFIPVLSKVRVARPGSGRPRSRPEQEATLTIAAINQWLRALRNTAQRAPGRFGIVALIWSHHLGWTTPVAGDEPWVVAVAGVILAGADTPSPATIHESPKAQTEATSPM